MTTQKIPETDSIEELARFWDTHDLMDFDDQLVEVAARNRAIEAAQVIEELIALAREMRASDVRPEELGLTTEEVASTTRSRPTTARWRFWVTKR